MNAIKPNLDAVRGLPQLDSKRFAKRSIKSVNDRIDKDAADRFASKSGFIVADMMPVDPVVRPLIYDGVTKEEKGRYQYLKVSCLSVLPVLLYHNCLVDFLCPKTHMFGTSCFISEFWLHLVTIFIKIISAPLV